MHYPPHPSVSGERARLVTTTVCNYSFWTLLSPIFTQEDKTTIHEIADASGSSRVHPPPPEYRISSMERRKVNMATKPSKSMRIDYASPNLLRVTRTHRSSDSLRETTVKRGLPSLEPCPYSRAGPRFLSTHTKSTRCSLSSSDTAALTLGELARPRGTFERVRSNLFQH